MKSVNPPLKLILQRQQGDCVIAAVATVARKSYAQVRRLSKSTRHGLDSIWTRWLLHVCGCEHKFSHRKDGLSAQEWARKHPRDLALLVVTRQSDGLGHAVVAHWGEVHDPAGNPFGGVVEEVYRITPKAAV